MSQQKLDVYALEELIDDRGYRGEGLQAVTLARELFFDEIGIDFSDGNSLRLSYVPDSLKLVEFVTIEGVERRFIPEGKSGYDTYFEEEREYDPQEIFDREIFNRLIDESLKGNLSKLYHSFVSEEAWLNLAFSGERFLEVRFKFPKDAVVGCVYGSKEDEIIYSPKLTDSEKI